MEKARGKGLEVSVTGRADLSREQPASIVFSCILYMYRYVLLGECSTLWGERERGSVVGVYVSSHRKLIGHIGCCRSPQLLAFSAGRAHTG